MCIRDRVITIHTNTTKNLYGVVNLPSSSNALATGDEMQVFELSTFTAMIQSSWYVNKINKMHFTKAINGYIVGDKGLIRHTTDGGMNWQIVKPVSYTHLFSYHLPVQQLKPAC